MALGTLKCDTIENDSSQSITVANLVSLDTGKANLSGATFTGDVTLNAQNAIRFGDSDSSNFIVFQAPGTVSTNSTWTLPSDAPVAGNVLKVSSVSSNNPTLEWGGGGKVLQVITQSTTSTFSSSTSNSGYITSSTAGTAIFAFNVTRQSSTSIMHCWASTLGAIGGNDYAIYGMFHGTTGISTAIFNGYAADAGGGAFYGSVPSSSLGSGAVLFQLRNCGTRNGSTNYTNQWSDGSTIGVGRGTYMTVMEVEP